MCCAICCGLFEFIVLVAIFGVGGWALAFREFWVLPWTLSKGPETRITGALCMVPLPAAILLNAVAGLVASAGTQPQEGAGMVVMAQVASFALTVVCVFVGWLIALMGYQRRRKRRAEKLYRD